ncbi:MAG TPA: hypothetical protein GXX28_02130 [Firmicutes bacterium]|nr:hypothetical protein [Bacillota bacterium]
MTRDEILAMKPGRELDALVAERVLGYKVVDVLPQGITYMAGKRKRWIKNPNYSTDVAAAWEVRSELLESHGGVELVRMCEKHPELCELTTSRWRDSKEQRVVIAVMADSMPEAVCKVALLAEIRDLEPFDTQGKRCDAWCRIAEEVS